MTAHRKNKAIGFIALAIGLLTLMLFVFEVRDGILQGSRAYGMKSESNPVTFYISTGFELLVGIGLSAFGIYSFRRKD